MFLLRMSAATVSQNGLVNGIVSQAPGVIHGYDNNSLQPVYFQVMLGKGRPETMGYSDDDLYLRRDAHLTEGV